MFDDLSDDLSDDNIDDIVNENSSKHNFTSRQVYNEIHQFYKGRLRCSSLPKQDKCFITPSKFLKDYRCKQPFIIRNCVDRGFGMIGFTSELNWLDSSSYFPNDPDVERDAFFSLDNQIFLKKLKCYKESIKLSEGLSMISQSNDPDFSGKKVYIRMYLNEMSEFQTHLNLDYLSSLAFEGFQDEKLDQNCEESFYGFRKKNIGVWTSSRGCVTPLHFDACHGFLAQIHGNKRFILAPPEDTSYMYWNANNSEENGFSSERDMLKYLTSDIVPKDLANYSYANWMVADLNAGDILYTPPGWWHIVFSESSSVSILVPFDPVYGKDNLPSYFY